MVGDEQDLQEDDEYRRARQGHGLGHPQEDGGQEYPEHPRSRRIQTGELDHEAGGDGGQRAQGTQGLDRVERRFLLGEACRSRGHVLGGARID